MGNCGLPGCANALLKAKNASVMPARQRMRPIKTRGLKKADRDADFFFIVNFPSVYSDEVPILPEPPSGCHAFFCQEIGSNLLQSSIWRAASCSDSRLLSEVVFID